MILGLPNKLFLLCLSFAVCLHWCSEEVITFQMFKEEEKEEEEKIKIHLRIMTCLSSMHKTKPEEMQNQVRKESKNIHFFFVYLAFMVEIRRKKEKKEQEKMKKTQIIMCWKRSARLVHGALTKRLHVCKYECIGMQP